MAKKKAKSQTQKLESVETNNVEQAEANAPKLDKRQEELAKRRQEKDAKAKAKAKKTKEASSGGLVKKTKEVVGELKRVTWPTFGQVVKTTGIVIAVVFICALVLLGIERLLALGYEGLAWLLSGGNG